MAKKVFKISLIFSLILIILACLVIPIQARPPGDINWNQIVSFFIKAPTAMPKSNSFEHPIYVTLSSQTPNTQIKYTKNGTIPSCNSGISYNGGIFIKNSSTIKAIACKNGQSSSVMSEHYNILTNNYGGGGINKPTEFGFDWQDVEGSNFMRCYRICLSYDPEYICYWNCYDSDGNKVLQCEGFNPCW